MYKILGLVLVLACMAHAEKFPIKAVSIVGGGILNPRTNEPIMIFGDVKFIQHTATSPVTVRLNITFFPSTDIIVNQQRGFHVHEFGVSAVSQDPNDLCESTGPHWNPTGAKHGSLRDSKGHEGDMGNVIVSPVNGVIQTEITSTKLSLVGKNSILGRSVVLHEKPDDEGTGNSPMSSKNGNAGKRIACGTIGLMQ